MSIGSEYIIRTGLAKKIINFPCSVFCSDAETGKKSVFVINCFENKFTIRKWFLSDYENLTVLPLFEDIIVENIFDNIDEIFNKKLILQYEYENIPSAKNFTFQPMESSLYFDRFNNYLNSDRHLLIRQHLLWKYFLERFHPEIIDFRNITSYDNSIENEEFAIQNHSPRTWVYWQTWMTQILCEDNIISPDYVFGSLLKNTFKI